VYELTEWGWELEPIVLALGSWGVRVPLPPARTTLNATSVLLLLRTSAHPDPKAPATIDRLELDDRVWTIRTAAGQVHVEPGEPSRADVCLRAHPETLNAFLDDRGALDAAVSDGSVIAAGDLSALAGSHHPVSRRRVATPGFVSSAASSFGVELVFLALIDSVGAITSAVGGGVTEAERDDDDRNDPQGVDSEADQPENQCGAQDDQHHLAEARPLAKQERDPLGQSAPIGCLAGAACRLGGRCWERSLR
jgi:hypothetical protein